MAAALRLGPGSHGSNPSAVTTPEVFVVRDRELLLDAVAARLVTFLVDRIAAAGSANLLVSGDRLSGDVMAAVSRGPAGDSVDWSAVAVWWANDTWDQTADRSAAALFPLLERLGIGSANIHPIPVLGVGQLPEFAAADYANELAAARHPDDHGSVPAFDVALLAVGSAGSVAGLQPERPTAYDTAAVAVDRASRQITLTAASLSTAREVWLLATGGAAAPGVHLALTAAGPYQVPAAGARGAVRTLMLADDAAASRLPHELRRIASP